MTEKLRSKEQEERIRRRAYELWEREGRPDNKQQVFWLRAEAELQAGDFTGNQGEGNRAAGQAFDRAQTEFAQGADVASKAAAPRDALGGPEGPALRKAEQIGKAHSHGEDPQLDRKAGRNSVKQP
jgi:hypothetical protein